MNVAKLEFPMEGFEEEYGKGRYSGRLNFKGLTLDFRNFSDVLFFAIL